MYIYNALLIAKYVIFILAEWLMRKCTDVNIILCLL